MTNDKTGIFRGYMIVTDLDGTFFGPHAARIERNIEAVKRFTAGGGIFTVATGRSSDVIADALPDLSELVNAPVIGCNGAQLYDAAAGVTTAERPLPPDVGEVFDYILEKYPGYGMRISVPGGFLVSRENYDKSAMLRRDLSRARASRVAFLPRSEWGSLKWYKLVVRAEPGEVDALRADIESAFPGRYCLSKSGSTFFELQSKDTDKAFWFGMLREYAAKRTGIPPIVIAAGDYENDLPMLRAADVGVCPANATEEVKREADFCLCANTEGVIAELVERIEKIENGNPV